MSIRELETSLELMSLAPSSTADAAAERKKKDCVEKKKVQDKLKMAKWKLSLAATLRAYSAMKDVAIKDQLVKMSSIG